MICYSRFFSQISRAQCYVGKQAYAGSHFLAHALQSSIAQRLGSHLLKQMSNDRSNRRSKACAHTVSAKLRISTGFRFRQGAKAPCGIPALHLTLCFFHYWITWLYSKKSQMSISQFIFHTDFQIQISSKTRRKFQSEKQTLHTLQWIRSACFYFKKGKNKWITVLYRVSFLMQKVCIPFLRQQ